MRWPAVALLACALWGTDIANMTGTWKLDVDRSHWGSKPKPTMVVIEIQHNEPQLAYSGKSTGPNGEPGTFAFRGAVDGKPYPVTTSYGPGKMTLKRVNPYTITSDFRSDDGRFVETATSTVSTDGKVMTRHVQLKSPDGSATWTEVYEKQ